jgi:hypothetical protein
VVKKMPVHNVGGEEIVVAPRSQNFFLYRRQGISINVSPKRRIWCLWLCSSTTNIDRIECSILLSGLAQEAEAAKQCTNCGSLNIMGPAFWGVNIPQAYQRVEYRGRVQIKGEEFSITGSIVYE